MADKANEATSRCQAPASPASATSSAFLPGQRDLDAPGQNLANSGDADDGDLPQTFNHLSIDEPIAMGKSGSTVLGVKPSTTSDMSGKPVRLPPELCLKMIKHLDAKSLKNARLVSKAWKDFVSLFSSFLDHLLISSRALLISFEMSSSVQSLSMSKVYETWLRIQSLRSTLRICIWTAHQAYLTLLPKPMQRWLASTSVKSLLSANRTPGHSARTICWRYSRLRHRDL